MPGSSMSMLNLPKGPDSGFRLTLKNKRKQTRTKETDSKKSESVSFYSSSAVERLLGRRDSAHWAGVCASTAINTYRRVDLIDIALAYCTCRALGNASAASNAIVRNFVSHFLFLLNVNVQNILQNYPNILKFQRSRPIF